MSETAARPALTRERILLATAALIEAEGVEAVSMRRVAAELGVAAMSLYNHVAGKDALLDGVAEHVMSAMDLAADPGGDFPGRCRALVRAFRDVARAHPRCVLLVLSRGAATREALRPVEHALAVAADAGFDGTTSVRVMRVLISYALGSLTREAHWHAAPLDDAGPPLAEAFPLVHALAGELADDDHEADFEFGLDLLIQAISGLQAGVKPG